MNNFLTLFIILMFSSSCLAQIPAKKYENMPQGTFKKARNGKIIQYDQRGKKVGTYELNNGKYVKIK